MSSFKLLNENVILHNHIEYCVLTKSWLYLKEFQWLFPAANPGLSWSFPSVGLFFISNWVGWKYLILAVGKAKHLKYKNKICYVL